MFTTFFDALNTFFTGRQFDVAILQFLNSLPEPFIISFGVLFVIANLSVVIKFLKGWL